MELPNRKSLRLHHYDYSTEGGYFITICTEQKKCTLAKVEAGNEQARATVSLTKLGCVARDTLLQLREKYDIHIDCYVIMPNHIHLILLMEKTEKSITVGQLIGAYKSMVVKNWWEICNGQGVTMGKIWQRGFYDHILRNVADYKEKARYIDENPDKWCLDDEYVPIT